MTLQEEIEQISAMDLPSLLRLLLTKAEHSIGNVYNFGDGRKILAALRQRANALLGDTGRHAHHGCRITPVDGTGGLLRYRVQCNTCLFSKDAAFTEHALLIAQDHRREIGVPVRGPGGD